MEDPIASNSTAAIFTSLSLILLSFFLYLTSQSNVSEAQRAAVLKSVHRDFPSSTHSNNQVPVALPKVSAIEQASKELQAIAAFHGSLLETDKHVQVQLAAASVFVADTDTIQPSFLKTLSALATITAKHNLSVKLRMVAPDVKSNIWQRGTTWEFGIAQAAAITRGFVDYGVPPENIRGQVFLALDDSGLPIAFPRVQSHERIELVLEELPHG